MSMEDLRIRSHTHAEERHFTRWYCVPWDYIHAGAWLAILPFLWALVIGFIELSQFLYAAEWQFVVSFSLQWVQLGILFLTILPLIYLAVKTDRDIRRLHYLDEMTHKRAIKLAKRSRYNAAQDMSFVSYYLLLTIVSLTVTACYGLGTPITWLHASSTANALGIVNYPISNASAFPVINGQVINQVTYRSYVHLINFLVCFMALAEWFRGRVVGMELYEALCRIDYFSGREGSEMDGMINRDEAVAYGKPQNGSINAVEMGTVVNMNGTTTQKTPLLGGAAALYGNAK